MLNFELKKHLKETNMTISELSEKTGISRNSLGLLINGKSRGIQFDTLEKISRIINVEIKDLFSMSFDYLEISAKNKKMRSSDLGINNNARYDFKQLVCNMNIDGTDYEFTIQYEIDLQLNILKDYNSEIKITLDLREFNYLNLFLPINSGVDTDIEHLTYTYFISTILQSNKDEIIELLNKGVGITLDRISYEIVKDAFHVISSGTLPTNNFEVIHDDFNTNNIENSNLITYIEDEDKILFTSVI
ncbi:helix-turn-helix domain-containing protein [Staphylococcus haemolyticus]|uniref:helix-turn-helix domain-containing protein n=1 Tax=Staphylococcus haemolyticus TaxID=1283 RepID=UPI003BF67D10